ncbi:hypothetical protein Efla_002981 [Eimeria flavescens]
MTPGPLARLVLLLGLGLMISAGLTQVSDAEEAGSEQEQPENASPRVPPWRAMRTLAIRADPQESAQMPESAEPGSGSTAEGTAASSGSPEDSGDDSASEADTELSQEGLFHKVLQTRTDERNDLASRLCDSLLPGIAPGELHLATIKALYTERVNIENALASVKAFNSLRANAESKMLFNRLNQRLAYSEKKLEGLKENMKQCLERVVAFLNYLAERRAAYGEITEATLQEVHKVNQAINILQEKRNFLKNCISGMDLPVLPHQGAIKLADSDASIALLCCHV